MSDDGSEEKRNKILWSLFFNFLIPSIIATIVGITSSNFTESSEGRVLFTMSGFLFPLIIVDIFRREHQALSGSYIKRQHFIDKPLKNGETVISTLLGHFSEDCYNRCSNFSEQCAGCEKFQGECNGLLRNYLYLECKALQDAISKAKEGEYNLSTKIKKFHTIAIDHLIATKSKNYDVLHWIGDVVPNEETYDALDFHFLNVLISALTKGKSPYYKTEKFKIRWILIGDKEKIMNTYDYIFYVIKELNLPNSVDISKFFTFYTITSSDYSARMANDLAKLSSLGKQLFQKEPSVGIFGNYFMFADAREDSSEHGTIYTNLHKSDNCPSIDEANKYFNSVLTNAKEVPYKDLLALYNNLLPPHRDETLKERSKKYTVMES
jgi:hypothetical protein